MSALPNVLDELAADAPVERLSWADVLERTSARRGRRWLAPGAAAAVLLAAAGTAVGVRLDLLTQQEALHETSRDHPDRLGPIVEIVTGDDWSLIAWRSAAGVCVDFAVPGNAAFSCGFPVRGAKPPSDHSGTGAPTHAVAGTISGGGLVGGDGKSTVFGIAARDVAAVRVELRDGRLLDAQLFTAPVELGADVKFFLLRLSLPPQRLDEPSPVAAFVAYGHSGTVIERFPL